MPSEQVNEATVQSLRTEILQLMPEDRAMRDRVGQLLGEMIRTVRRDERTKLRRLVHDLHMTAEAIRARLEELEETRDDEA